MTRLPGALEEDIRNIGSLRVAYHVSPCVRLGHCIEEMNSYPSTSNGYNTYSICLRSVIV